jgi:uncharacterized membrane protein YkoI
MGNGIRVVLLAGLLPFTGVAWAQGVAQPGYFKGDVAAFHGTPDTLGHIISKIEAATAGRVVEIRFAEKDGMPGYQVAMAKGGEITFIRIDEQSGNIMQIGADSMPVWMMKWKVGADVHLAESAKVPLSKAILTAEQADNNSPAIAAGIARSASNPESDVHAYNVLIAANGMTRRVSVDDSTGEVISDPGALSDWP